MYPNRLILCFALFLAQAAAQTTNNTIQLDQQVLQNSTTSLYQQIIQAAQTSQASPEKQHLNVAFAFSTGHFPSDPTMAQAAREMANALVRNYLVEGDRISAYAWEMNVWSHLGTELNPYTLPASLKDDVAKQQVNQLWPLSAQPATTGGHDTEQAIIEITQQLPSQDTILVLLTNTAYSVASSDKKPIGTNDASYQEVLQNWKRMESNSASGASVQLPFQEQGGQTRTLDAIIVTPNTYQATALAQSRSELLTKAKQEALQAVQPEPEATPPSPSTPFWIWLLAAGVLGGLALIFIRSRNSNTPTSTPRASKNKKMTLQVELEGKKFKIPGPKDPVLICHIRKDQGMPAANQVVLVAQKSIPADLAQLERSPQGILIKVATGVRLQSIDGQAVQDPLIPFKIGLYRIELRGKFQESPALPAKPFQHELKIRISEHIEENPILK